MIYSGWETWMRGRAAGRSTAASTIPHRPGPIIQFTLLRAITSFAFSEFALAVGSSDDVTDEPEHAVGRRRPVGRAAEPHDDEFLAWDDDDILPDRALGEEGIARPAMFRAIIGAKAVAEIGPEAGTHSDPGIRRCRGRVFHPALWKDAFSPNYTVIEIERAEACPVACGGQHLARSF